jgi:molybdopterin converting factor small subunit
LKVNVALNGKFRDTFQASELEIELEEESSIRDLPNRLCDTEERRSNIFDKSNTRLKPSVTITKNGRFIIHLSWLDTPLSDGERLVIFTLHSGG